MITAQAIEFEKVSQDDMESLKTANTFTADDKYSLLKRDNLTQPIQMQLSKKQKFFLNFVLYF